MKKISSAPSCNLLLPFGSSGGLIPAHPIYEKLTPDFLGELVRSGGWHLVLGEGAKAQATGGGHQLHTHITDGGASWYAVQVSFIPVPLECGGNYLVSFKARADREQAMILDIAQVGTWYSYSSRLEYRITPILQEFRAAFSIGPAPSEPNARFEFNLGGCGPNEVLFEDAILLQR